MRYISPKDAADLDAVETREWLDSLDYVLQSGGPAKVARLLRELTIHARQNGVKLPFTAIANPKLVGYSENSPTRGYFPCTFAMISSETLRGASS